MAADEELQARGVTPKASRVTGEVALKVVAGEQVDPAVEAVPGLLVDRAGVRGESPGC